MLVRTARRAVAPRNLVATTILGLTLAGVAFAAINGGNITNNSVTGLDIKNDSLGTADVRNGSLRGRDFLANSITGNEIDEPSLDKVPSAAAADTATTATNVALADKAKGFTRVKPTFITAFEAADTTDGQANAPLTTLVEAGSLKIQAKCYHAADTTTVYSALYATTTKDAAMLHQEDSNSLDGGNTVNNVDYLYTDTTLQDRRFGTADLADGDGVRLFDPFFDDVVMVGVDGSWISGKLTAIIRSGTPAGTPSTFYGTERSCAYFGQLAHSGNS